VLFRSEVDGDAGQGKIPARIADGGPDPLPALPGGGIGKPHHIKGGQPRGNVYFHVHDVGFHSPDGPADNARDDGSTPPDTSGQRRLPHPDGTLPSRAKRTSILYLFVKPHFSFRPWFFHSRAASPRPPTP